MTPEMREDDLEVVRLGTGDIADALHHAAFTITGIDASRKGTVVMSDDLGSTARVFFPSVLAADVADYLVVISSGGVTTVNLDTERVKREPFEDLGSVGSAHLTIADVQASEIDIPPETAELQLRVMMAAALIQNAKAAYHLARDHVREREQFGAPLVKIAGVAANLARVQVEIQRLEAAFGRTTKADATLTDATVLSGVAADACNRVARLTHQLIGALGIREDYPLQAHTRRIWAARDFPRGEYVDTTRVGMIARSGGESVVWDVLTTPN